MKSIEVIVSRVGDMWLVLMRAGWVSFATTEIGLGEAVERLSFVLEGDALRLQPKFYSEAVIRKGAETDPRIAFPAHPRTLEDVVRPNDFARWLRAQERSA